jgi:hypothetical protein
MDSENSQNPDDLASSSTEEVNTNTKEEKET